VAADGNHRLFEHLALTGAGAAQDAEFERHVSA
jgi:hypothetical protein